MANQSLYFYGPELDFMQHNYSPDGTSLTDVTLDDGILRNIGRIFIGAAELEDVVTLYLCSLAKLSEGHVVMLLGRAALSKKFELARNFAKAHGEKELERFKATLGNEHLQAMLEFRNTLAHGAMLGLTKEGRIAFRTARQIDQNTTSVTMEVNSYLPEEFQHCADSFETVIPWLESELQVNEARAAHKTNELGPHTKAK
jgi:hypothetical protein